jgi:hypothetical protein
VTCAGGVVVSGKTEFPNPAPGPWRRLSAPANEADKGVVPEPEMLLVSVAWIALFTVRNRYQGAERFKGLTLERRKKETLGNLAKPQRGAKSLYKNSDQRV